MSGGLAAAAVADGREVEILHLTRGERGHPAKTPGEFGPQLEVEMREAAEILGVRCTWPGLAAPLDERHAYRVVADVVAETRPQVIVTHWRGSWHPSHVRAHNVVMATAAGRGVTVLFGENCEDLDGFRAEYFVPMSGAYERWLKAVRCYELFRLSEPGSAGPPGLIPYWAYYTAAARVRGLQAGLGLAESVMLGLGVPPAWLSHGRPRGSSSSA